jgi:hypothetical protein
LKIAKPQVAGLTVNKWHSCRLQTCSLFLTVEEWRKKHLPKLIEGYEPKNIIMLVRLGCCSGFCLTGHWVWKGCLQWQIEIQGQDNSSLNLQCLWDWQTLTIS